MKKIDYHAKLVIHGLPDMKSVTYRRLVDWLGQITKELKEEDDTKVFSKRFTLRLMK